MGLKRALGAGVGWLPLFAVLVVVPFFIWGTSDGHDLTFHANTWLDVVQHWKEGTIYPHWAAWANFGAGDPRLVFYPPVSWTLGALCGVLLPWRAVPGTLSVIVCLASGVSMFLLAREWLDDAAAVTAALLYAFNPYQLIVIYERAAYGELFAAVLFPVVLLFAARRNGSPATNIAGLAFSFCGVWLSNLPAAVICTYSTFLVAAYCAWRQRRWEPLLRFTGGLMLGLTLAGFYLVPVLRQQQWVQITEAVGPGASPSNNFLFSHTDDPEHDAVLLRTSKFALCEVLALAATAWLASSWKSRSRDFYDMLVGLAALSVLLMLPISAVLWKWLPKLQFVQFPWRWLIVLNLSLALLTTMSLERLSRPRLAALLLIPFLISVCYWHFHQTIYPEDMPPALADAISSGDGYQGAVEYTPQHADSSMFQPNLPRIAIAVATESDEQRQEDLNKVAHSTFQEWGTEHKRFSIDSQLPTRSTLRLLWYPAWRVRVNGTDIQPEFDDTDGRMVLSLPAGHHYVAIDYRWTADRTLGWLLSIASIGISGTLFRFGRRRSLPA